MAEGFCRVCTLLFVIAVTSTCSLENDQTVLRVLRPKELSVFTFRHSNYLYWLKIAHVLKPSPLSMSTCGGSAMNTAMDICFGYLMSMSACGKSTMNTFFVWHYGRFYPFSGKSFVRTVQENSFRKWHSMCHSAMEKSGCSACNAQVSCTKTDAEMQNGVTLRRHSLHSNH